MLRMAFGHAQLLLYRPFLHYLSLSNRDKAVDQRAYACASACVSISRNIVHISTEMRRRGVFAGAYWFSMYTTFFAIVSILYFVLENPTNPTSFELLRDAVEGKEVLAYFSKSSMAADRCSVALKVGFHDSCTQWILTSGRACLKDYLNLLSTEVRLLNRRNGARIVLRKP